MNRADVFDEQAYVLFYERDEEEAPPPHAAAPLSRWGPQALEPPKTVRTPSPPVDDDDDDDGLGRDDDDDDDGLGRDDDDADDADADPVHSGDAIGPTGPPRGHPAAGKIPPGPDERPRRSVLGEGEGDAGADADDAYDDGNDGNDGNDAPTPARTPPLDDRPAVDDDVDDRDGDGESPAWATTGSSGARRRRGTAGGGTAGGAGGRTMARRQRRRTDGEEGGG